MRVRPDHAHGLAFKDFPGIVGVHYLFEAAIALNDQAGFVGHLRHGSHFGEVPQDCRQRVLAGYEVRGNIQGLVAPMVQVTARGPGKHPLAIYE